MKDKMIKEVIQTALEVSQYPEFYEATVKETYDVALGVVELERLSNIENLLKDIRSKL